ncbi:MAG TPA: carbon-nitrogen hydrolase family protein [Candidatus Saccharimonadia bacterium]
MNKLLKVALVQKKPPENQHDAQVRGEAYCREAASQNADIILFPELWSTGYAFPDPSDDKQTARWRQHAASRHSEFVSSFQSLAKELETAIAITYLEDSGRGQPKNSLTLFDRRGDEILHYSKVHTCDFGPELLTAAGNEFKTNLLSTTAGDIRVGAMICFDREQPESARLLMLQGAEIILTPNACGLGRAQLQQFSTRAYENMVGMAMANYPAPRCNGRSVAYSPIVVDENHDDVENNLVLAGPEEGIYYAEFDIEQIRAWREKQIWGNAYRHPEAYGDITSNTINAPFTR